MIKQINLRIGDKFFYGGKLHVISKNNDSGFYLADRVGAEGSTVWQIGVYGYEVEELYTRKCVECYSVDVMPDAKNGRCEDCLNDQKERLAV